MFFALPRRWWIALFALAAGAALRLWFIHAYPEVQGNPLIYGDIAKNWMLHGIYGRGRNWQSMAREIAAARPEWGALLDYGREYITTQWWLEIMPGLVIVLVALSVTSLGRTLQHRLEGAAR